MRRRLPSDISANFSWLRTWLNARKKRLLEVVDLEQFRVTSDRDGQRIANPRYSRLPVGATSWPHRQRFFRYQPPVGVHALKKRLLTWLLVIFKVHVRNRGNLGRMMATMLMLVSLTRSMSRASSPVR